MSKKTTVFVCMICMVFCLCSCGSKESELVGRWMQVSGDSIEFFKDNTYVTDEGKHTSNPSSVSGTYEITDDGRLKLNELGSAELYTYTIKNNKLTLKDTSNNEEEIYYLDVKDKKPKEKYLPEDEVVKLQSKIDENEKIVDCKYFQNYTDKNGYYHAIYRVTITVNCKAPCEGRIEYWDYIYITSEQWVLFDDNYLPETDEADIEQKELITLLDNAVGTWEYNSDNMNFKLDVKFKEDDNVDIAYSYQEEKLEKNDTITMNKSKYVYRNYNIFYQTVKDNDFYLFQIDGPLFSHYSVLFQDDCCVLEYYPDRGSSPTSLYLSKTN